MPEVKAEEKKAETPPPPPEKKELTPEELDEQHKKVISAFFRDPDPAPKKESTKEPDPPKVEEKKADEKPPEEKKPEPPKTEEKKPVVVPPEPEIPKPLDRKPATAADAPRYTPAEKKTLAAAVYLEKTYPDQYGGVQKKVEDFWKSEPAYIKKWEAENPGKPFNKDEAEHNDFYDQNDPNIDEEDLKDAREQILKTETLTEADEKAKRIAAERALKDAESKILDSAADGVKQLFETAIPDLIKEISPTGMTLTKEFAAKLLDENPVAHSLLMEEGEALNLMLIEWKKLTDHPDAYAVNSNKTVRLRNSNRTFFPQEEVLSFFIDLEEQIAAQPAEESMADGRRFLKADRYRKQEAAIVDASNSTEEAERRLADFYGKYWKLEASHIADALIKRSAEKVKSRLDQVESTYKKREEKSKASAKVEEPPKAEEKKELPKPGKSPEAITASETRDNLKSPTVEPTQEERIRAQFFG